MPVSADGELRFETALQETGHPATVVRDGQGQLLYPGFVPPASESPATPSSSQTKTESHSIDPQVSSPPTNNVTRPKLAGKSASEAPRLTRRQSSSVPLPSIKRAGTNASQLQHALWTKSRDAHDSSSSDSSSDEDEDEGGPSDGIARTDHAAGSKTSHSQNIHRFRVANDSYTTKGRVSKRDGRLAISIKDLSNDNYLPKALGAAVSKVVPLKKGEIRTKPDTEAHEAPIKSAEAFLTPDSFRCPRLNIVIMVIGSRGDAQPFLKIGKVLKEKYGHRVRIATHPAFREFVEQDSGLEFFSVGGDPSELMAFMVKNPGLIPTIDTLRAGDIGRRRAAMNEMFGGFWRACVNATDDEKDIRNLRMMGEMQPFVADAIIANPASFAHVHCAEALGIPLILSFTFPYTPTRSFPHPMANVKKSNVDPGYTNFISYPLVEMMIWQGLGDLVNDLRVKTLWLDPVSTLWAPGSLYRMNVPFAYLWSPGLVPKPPDWGDEIDISGFVFLDLASSFTPPDPLENFLNTGEPPIYIGFGSIVVDDANKFTEMIFEAVKLAGVRALVSKGWGGIGGDKLDVPDNIFLLDNTPHDWLFPRVKACVIHGGAGTTAIALKCGKPTMVVPFFGDQFFWGNMLARAKAGPEPVPHKQLSVEKLTEGIKFCLTKEALENAQFLARDIAREGDGADNMCAFFHSHLTLSGKKSMRCSIFEDRVAVWHLKSTSLRLSVLAADILVARGYVQWRRLRLIRHCEWNDFEGPGEPVTGVLGSVATTVGETFGGIASVPAQIAKHSTKKRRRKQRQSEEHEERMSTIKKKAQRQSGHADDSPKTSKTEKEPCDKLPVPTGDGPHEPNTINDAASSTTLQDPTPEETGTDNHYVSEVSRGALKSARAIASAPIDLSIALAQGFHNAPRLYGDDTVRRPPRVTGIKSGLRAARTELTYGFYDAWTGVVRLPVRGAKKNGAKGFAKGVGMGLSGLVLKELAAITGPFGYTLKGIKKQVERRKQPYKHVRRARILQGQLENKELNEEERRSRVYEVERSWRVLRHLMETVEKQSKQKGGSSTLSVQLNIKRHLVGEAYESVQMAEAVLEAVRAGEDIKDVMERYKRSESAEEV